MNHYWIKDDQAKVIDCPCCNVNSMKECLTNKDKPHAQGYVHRVRSGYYLQILNSLVKEMEVYNGSSKSQS